MKRIGPMLGISLVALGSFGVLFGLFMYASSEQADLGTRESPKPQPHQTRAWNLAGAARGLEDYDAFGGDQDPDLGGVEWLGNYGYDVAGYDAADDDDNDEDDDNEGDEEVVDDGDDDEEAIIARERELVERRVAEITTETDREAVDPDWAPAVELGIADGVAAHGPPGTMLVSTTCKTTLCIMEIEFPPGSKDTMRMSWLAAVGLSGGLFVHDRPESDASARTVAYLAREGYSLPSSGQHDP